MLKYPVRTSTNGVDASAPLYNCETTFRSLRNKTTKRGSKGGMQSVMSSGCENHYRVVLRCPSGSWSESRESREIPALFYFERNEVR